MFVILIKILFIIQKMVKDICSHDTRAWVQHTSKRLILSFFKFLTENLLSEIIIVFVEIF